MGSAPFVVPGAAFASMDAALPGGLEKRAAAHAVAWRDDGGSEWRAGLHALYLEWLATGSGPGVAAVARAAGPAAVPVVAAAAKPKPRGGLFACFACGAADADDDGGARDDRRAAAAGGGDALAARVAAGFAAFRGLPHSSVHPYWREAAWVDATRVLADAGGAPMPGAEGAEVDDDLSR